MSTSSRSAGRSHGYDYFSPGVPAFQISHRLGDFTQPIAPVDDRRDLAGLHELTHDYEVLLCGLGHHRTQPAAYER